MSVSEEVDMRVAEMLLTRARAYERVHENLGPSDLVVAILLEKEEGAIERQQRQRGCPSVRGWTCALE